MSGPSRLRMVLRWSLVGYLAGGLLRAVVSGLWFELARRAAAGGRGESAGWSEPAFYILVHTLAPSVWGAVGAALGSIAGARLAPRSGRPWTAFDLLALSLLGATFVLMLGSRLLVPRRSLSTVTPVMVRLIETSRPPSVEAYGPSGGGPRHAPSGQSWLMLSVEVSLPGQPMGLNIPLDVAQVVAMDARGDRHPFLAIAPPGEPGAAPRFLFLEDAFRDWNGLQWLSAVPRSPWQVAADPARRDRIVHWGHAQTVQIDRQRRLWVSNGPGRMLLLFALGQEVEPTELRLAENGWTPLPGQQPPEQH